MVLRPRGKEPINNPNSKLESHQRSKPLVIQRCTSAREIALVATFKENTMFSAFVSPPFVSPPFVSPPLVSPPFVSPPFVSPPFVSPPFVSPPFVSPPFVFLMFVSPP